MHNRLRLYICLCISVQNLSTDLIKHQKEGLLIKTSVFGRCRIWNKYNRWVNIGLFLSPTTSSEGDMRDMVPCVGLLLLT